MYTISIQAFLIQEYLIKECLEPEINEQHVIVNKQQSRVNCSITWVKQFAFVIPEEVVSILLIDVFRLLVYYKVNLIDYKMKRERFTDIYLHK